MRIFPWRLSVVLRRRLLMIGIVLGVPMLLWSAAQACDTCGCTAIPLDQRPFQPGWQLGLTEQFTEFDRLQQDSTSIPNSLNQHIDSSVTQLLVGYNFDSRVGLMLNVPFISRSFNRQIAGQIQSGNVSGLGDMTLQARWTALAEHHGDDQLNVNVLGGFKLPSGSPGYLKEQAAAMLGGPDSVVGGHDLTLGSGSLDEILGASLYFRSGRFFVTANVQEAFRNPGAYAYRFANEFQWDAAPGYYFTFSKGSSLALQVAFNGQIKGTDTFLGNIPATDTGINEVYVGPRLTATFGKSLSAFADVALPIHQTNTDLQLVPSYRVHGGLSYRF